jgi:hypothetical protein
MEANDGEKTEPLPQMRKAPLSGVLLLNLLEV